MHLHYILSLFNTNAFTGAEHYAPVTEHRIDARALQRDKRSHRLGEALSAALHIGLFCSSLVMHTLRRRHCKCSLTKHKRTVFI